MADDAFAAPGSAPEGDDVGAFLLLRVAAREVFRAVPALIGLLLLTPVIAVLVLIPLGCVYGLVNTVFAVEPESALGGLFTMSMLAVVAVPANQVTWDWASERVVRPRRRVVAGLQTATTSGPTFGMTRSGDGALAAMGPWLLWTAGAWGGAMALWVMAVFAGGFLAGGSQVDWLFLPVVVGTMTVLRVGFSPWALVAAGLADEGSLRVAIRELLPRLRRAAVPGAVVYAGISLLCASGYLASMERLGPGPDGDTAVLELMGWWVVTVPLGVAGQVALMAIWRGSHPEWRPRSE